MTIPNRIVPRNFKVVSNKKEKEGSIFPQNIFNDSWKTEKLNHSKGSFFNHYNNFYG